MEHVPDTVRLPWVRGTEVAEAEEGGRTRGLTARVWPYHVFGIFGQQRHGLFIRDSGSSSLD